MLKVKVLTIFPEMFPGFLGYSLTGRALEEKKWQIDTVNIRDYALDKHKSVDDTPCGGGAGMIMRPDVLGEAIEHNHSGGKIIYMSPKGKPLTQAKVRELSMLDEVTVEHGAALPDDAARSDMNVQGHENASLLCIHCSTGEAV